MSQDPNATPAADAPQAGATDTSTAGDAGQNTEGLDPHTQGDGTAQVEGAGGEGEHVDPDADPEQQEADKALAKGKNYYRKQIDKKTREAEEAKRDRQELLGLVKQLIPQQQQRDQQQGDADQGLKPPVRTDFIDYEAWLDAKAEYKAQVKAQETVAHFMRNLGQAAQVQGQRNASERAAADFVAKRDAEAATIPGYADALEAQSELPVAPHVAALIQQAEKPAALVHYFALNPKVVGELSNMAPAQAAMRIGAIVAGLKPPAKVTNAPSPGNPVGGKSAGTEDAPEDTEAYMRWAQKRGMK